MKKFVMTLLTSGEGLKLLLFSMDHVEDRLIYSKWKNFKDHYCLSSTMTFEIILEAIEATNMFDPIEVLVKGQGYFKSMSFYFVSSDIEEICFGFE